MLVIFDARAQSVPLWLAASGFMLWEGVKVEGAQYRIPYKYKVGSGARSKTVQSPVFGHDITKGGCPCYLFVRAPSIFLFSKKVRDHHDKCPKNATAVTLVVSYILPPVHGVISCRTRHLRKSPHHGTRFTARDVRQGWFGWGGTAPRAARVPSAATSSSFMSLNARSKPRLRRRRRCCTSAVAPTAMMVTVGPGR